MVNSHMDMAQREGLAALGSSDQDEVIVDGSGDKAKPFRHRLHRTPTPTRQAHWEAVQQAREQGFSLRAIVRELGMSRVAERKYALAESPLTNKLNAKAEILAVSLVAED